MSASRTESGEMANEQTLIEMAGWLGVIFYVLGYFLLSIGRISSTSYTFHFLNIAGAIGLITDSFYYQDMPNLTVNVVWFLIGAFAVGKRMKSKSDSDLGH